MTWSKDIVEWRQDGITYLSVVFTWQLRQALTRVQNPMFGEERFIIGGPAVQLMPDYFLGSVEKGCDIPGVLQRHNPQATRTSLGCPNRCLFCSVSKIEGDLVELDDWPVLPIVCDNNLLACSDKHFNRVIDKLKMLEWCDFNQGLDARLLTQAKADRLAELQNPHIRLAWDNIGDERAIFRAVTMLRKAGLPRKKISCYVLIGFNDTPADALYRLETLYYGLGITTSPMRYQPLNSTVKNSFVALGWTHGELVRYMQYWSNLRHMGGVPFDNWEKDYKEKRGDKRNELELM